MNFRTCLIIASVAYGFGAHGSQYLLWDYEVSWPGNSTNPTCKSVSDNWNSPDYYNGTVYYRIEVKSKPSAQPMKIQLCVWQGAGETCSASTGVQFSSPGVYVFSQSPAAWWKNGSAGNINWATTRKMCFNLKTSDGCLVQTGACGSWCWSKCISQSISSHVPITFRITTICVSKGEKLSWPAQLSDISCPAQWNCEGGSVSAMPAPIEMHAENRLAVRQIGKNTLSICANDGVVKATIATLDGRVLASTLARREGAFMAELAPAGNRVLVIITEENHRRMAQIFVAK